MRLHSHGCVQTEAVDGAPWQSRATILDRLAAADLMVFPFDQHAQRKDGVMVEFFGHPAGSLRSLAVIALGTGAPMVPASCWREPDGR